MATKLPMALTLSIVYSAQARAVLEISMQVEQGTTAGQAIQQSGIVQQIHDSLLQALELGVWGKKVHSSHVVCEGDRIELYRPLTVDPKVARRERFVKQGARTAGLFATRRAGAKAGY